MIRSLHVEGWRVFADLDLQLDDGVTFIVAENGVGKTSLVQAAAWGLYGQLSGVDARPARRVGSARTRVEIELQLPDGRGLIVARELNDRGESTRICLDGTVIDDPTMSRIIAEAYGASREFLSKTTVIPGDSVTNDATSSFQLREHLCKVFGVDELQDAARKLLQIHRDAETTAKQIRQRARRAETDLASLRADLVQAEERSSEADAVRDAARDTLAALQNRLSRAEATNAARAAATEAWQAFVDLLNEARPHFGSISKGDDVRSPAALAALLETTETAAAASVDELRREAATTTGRLAAIRAATDELHTAGAECPVCRRELSPEDVVRADQAHERDTASLLARERELNDLADAEGARLAVLRALSRRAARLADVRVPTEDHPIDIEALSLELDHARNALDQLTESAAEARVRRIRLVDQINDEESRAREAGAALLAHRREAVTSIAAEVMAASADKILSDRIDPLATAVAHRWKRVFGERGMLQLRSDGRLVLVRGVHEIPFGQFSSGEKVIALLATRLLVLGASTRASFIWLDEPLEHLDPKNRRLTASLMATAGKHVRQILITTYEETLARRLAASAHAQLRYVRAASPD
jgi:DNA repair exonuclease SbcCD ATPase subunit